MSYATKIVNRLIGERDWSAQEVSHLLFEIPLFSSSRQVITFDCRPEDEIGTVVDLEDETNSGKPILQKYKERRVEFGDTSLLGFLQNYEHGSRKVHKPRPRAKPRVIVYQPQYRSQPTHDDYPQFCRTRIVLHHPWRVYPSLPWNGCNSWASALDHCKANCSPHPHDCLEPLDTQPPPDDFNEEFPPDPDEHDAMALLAGETAFRNPAARHEDPDNLGERTDDWRYYWTAHVDTYRQDLGDGMPDIHSGKHWWKRAQELLPSYAQTHLLSQDTINRLAPEQQLIYDKVINHFRNADRIQLLLNIDGRAGTGKSFIIQVLSAHLAALSNSHDTIVRCAPTGAASFGISGSTVHALLRLPINKSIESLGPGPAQAIQLRLAKTRYLIVDEKSMISLKTLAFIDFRLQQAFGNSVRFGGISILLFGDFWQLPPVRDKALYFNSSVITQPSVAHLQPPAVPSQSEPAPIDRESRGPGAPSADVRLTLDDLRGAALYRAFDESIELVVQQRQDVSQVRFAAALDGLRSSQVTRSDWETLTSRCQVCISLSKRHPGFDWKFQADNKGS